MTKLSKLLKTLPDEQVIKVGTDEGNGWWYVGTVKDFVDNIDVYDQKLKATVEKYCKGKRTAFNSRLQKGTPEYYARAILPTSNWERSLNVEHYNIWLDGWFKSIIRSKNELIKLENYCKNYQHLWARDVTDWSKADDAIEENCLRIVIYGVERGIYWATSDAKEFPSIGLDIHFDEEEIKEEVDEVA